VLRRHRGTVRRCRLAERRYRLATSVTGVQHSIKYLGGLFSRHRRTVTASLYSTRLGTLSQWSWSWSSVYQLAHCYKAATICINNVPVLFYFEKKSCFISLILQTFCAQEYLWLAVNFRSGFYSVLERCFQFLFRSWLQKHYSSSSSFSSCTLKTNHFSSHSWKYYWWSLAEFVFRLEKRLTL